jgi:hypothetical protein
LLQDCNKDANYRKYKKTNNMKKINFFKRVVWLLIPLLTLFNVSAWGADETLELAKGSISSSYSTGTGTQSTSASNSIGVAWTNCLYSAGFQLRADDGVYQSTSYPSTNSVIKSITLTVASGTPLLFGSYNNTTWYAVDYTSGTAKNVENLGFRYFKITSTATMSKFSALTVVYTTPTNYTITYNDKDGEHTVSALKGRNIVEVLSEAYSGADPASCDAVKYPYFFGWKSSEISGKTTTKPTILTSEVVTGAATYYAVWTDVELTWGAATSIAAGDKVVFCYVNGGTKKEATSLNGSYLDVSDFTTAPAGTFTFVVETGNGGTGFSFARNGSFLQHENDKKITISPIKNDASSWNASFDGTTATIQNVGNTDHYIKYNTSSPRFTSYSSSAGGTAWPQIYKKQQSGTAYYITKCCDELGSISGSVTLTKTTRTMTATWNKTSGDHETGYKVQLYDNNGSGAKGSAIGGPVAITGKETANRTHTFSGLTYNHQYFIGVTPTYDGDGNYCEEGTEVTGNATTDAGYTVTYAHGTGATGEMSDPNSPYDAGATVTVLGNTFEKCGATFNAWSAVDASADPVDVSGGSFTMPSSNVTITATWTNKQDEFLDYMHENSRSTRSGSYTTPTLSNSSPGEACEGTHYKFMGWVEAAYINEDGTLKDGYTLIPGSESGHCADNKTFYAIWAEEE